MLMAAGSSTSPVPQRATSCPPNGLPPQRTTPPITAVHIKQSSWWNNTCSFVRSRPGVAICAGLGMALLVAGAVSLRNALITQRNHELFHRVWKYDESWWNEHASQTTTNVERWCPFSRDEKAKIDSRLEKKTDSNYYCYDLKAMVCIEKSAEENCLVSPYHGIPHSPPDCQKVISNENIRQILNKSSNAPVTHTDLESIGFKCDAHRRTIIQTLDLGQGKRAVNEHDYTASNTVTLYDGDKQGEPFRIDPNDVTRTGRHTMYLSDVARGVFRFLGAECHQWHNNTKRWRGYDVYTCDTEPNWRN